MKIYIAGPMSGYPEFNFPAFNVAAHNFRFLGWEVFNPAEKEAEKVIHQDAFKTGDYVAANAAGFPFKDVYKWDVTKVIEADAIFMLKGWEESLGAVGEHAVAQAVQKHCPEYQIMYESS